MLEPFALCVFHSDVVFGVYLHYCARDLPKNLRLYTVIPV